MSFNKNDNKYIFRYKHKSLQTIFINNEPTAKSRFQNNNKLKSLLTNITHMKYQLSWMFYCNSVNFAVSRRARDIFHHSASSAASTHRIREPWQTWLIPGPGNARHYPNSNKCSMAWIFCHVLISSEQPPPSSDHQECRFHVGRVQTNHRFHYLRESKVCEREQHDSEQQKRNALLFDERVNKQIKNLFKG